MENNEISSNNNFCSKCIQQPSSTTAKFCMNCGTKLLPKPSPLPTVPKGEKKEPVLPQESKVETSVIGNFC